MDLETFKIISQRFDRLETSYNLLQIQVNVLQSIIEKNFPNLQFDLESAYHEKVEAYYKSLPSFLENISDVSNSPEIDSHE